MTRTFVKRGNKSYSRPRFRVTMAIQKDFHESSGSYYYSDIPDCFTAGKPLLLPHSAPLLECFFSPRTKVFMIMI